MIKKILHSTIAKLIIGFVVIFAACWIPQVWLKDMLKANQVIPIVRHILIPTITVILILLSYITLYRYYEKRKITELATCHIGKYLIIGLIIGFVLPSLMIGVAYLRGEYTVLSISSLTDTFLRNITISILYGIGIAVFEEVLFRGVVFRLMEEKLGSYIALAISCVIFGFIHLANGSDSLLPGITISIISILITAAYMYTRNLWFPIAIHFAWNFTEGDIFGTAVSGNVAKTSIIVSKLEGSQWFTGGAWGIEATVQALIFGLIAGSILLILCRKKGQIVKPYWKNTL
ncbi:MAG: CPBP family intramembrane metalloprotease [Prevotellaceae bacterium]|jgi:membrane protease YdiL (CAAX protease family)|nr:CPBP family intramembrane metalloprotease [Prevotellaceae bacterium]